MTNVFFHQTPRDSTVAPVKDPKITLRAAYPTPGPVDETLWNKWCSIVTRSIHVDWPNADISITLEDNDTDDSARVTFARSDNMTDDEQWKMYIIEMNAQARVFEDMEAAWEAVL
jgi:hypothetical protein